ncbi:hypothetical protein D3C72_2121970 [compost metagenome]
MRLRIATDKPPPAATVPIGFLFSSEMLATTCDSTICVMKLFLGVLLEVLKIALQSAFPLYPFDRKC